METDFILRDRQILPEGIEEALAESQDLERCDILTAGFPCQDISIANPKAEGLNGERSGLWWETFRIIREARPRFILLENVPELLNRGFGDILAALASIGYDAEWRVICSSQVGLEQRRKRLFILSYSHSFGVERLSEKSILEKLDLSSRQAVEQIQDTRERFHTFESRLCRTLHGLPNGVHRVRSLGNAIVPQVAMAIFDCIKRIECDG